MRRDLVPLSAAGMLVTALGALAYVGGWRLGWVELMVVAAGCITALVLAVPFVIGRMRLDVVRTLEPSRVMVGEPSLAVLNVVNPKSTPVRPRVIEDAVADKYVRVEVPTLSGGDRHQQTYKLPTATRGVYQIGPAVIARQDPLQLMRREVRQADADTLWVHPRYVPLAPLSGRVREGSRGSGRRRLRPLVTLRSMPCASTSLVTTSATSTGCQRRVSASPWSVTTWTTGARS